MADKDYKIKIEADGGKSAAKEFQDVAKAADDLGDSTKKSSFETLGLGDRASKAKDKLAEFEALVNDATGSATAGGGAGSGLSGFASVLSKAKQGVSALTGMLTSAAGGPIGLYIGALTLTIATIRKLTQHLEDTKKVAEMTFPPIAVLQEEGATTAEQYASAQRRSADALRDSAGAVDSYSDKLQRLKDQEAALSDASLGEELALIDLDELKGDLTEAEAELARFDARREAATRKRQAEEAALTKELEAQERLAAEAQERANRAAPGARDARADLERFRDQRSQAPELKDFRGRVDEAAEAFNNRDRNDAEEGQRLYDELQKAQEDLQTEYSRMVEQKKEELEEMVQVFRDANDSANDLRGQARDARTALEDFQGPGQEVFAREQRAEDARRRAAEIRQERAAQAAKDAERAQGIDEVNAQAKGLVDSFSNATADSGNQELVQAIRGLLAPLQDGTNVGELASVAGSLTQAADSLRSHNAEAAQIVQGLKAKVETLESQLSNLRTQ